MLGIFLLILKVLGIFILSIIGIVLLILLLVLFAPIRYSSEGSKYGNDLKVNAMVTYLNPILRVKICYPNNEIVNVKLLGFTVFPVKQKEKVYNEQREEKKEYEKRTGHVSETCESVEKTFDAHEKSTKKEDAKSISECSAISEEEVGTNAPTDVQKDNVIDTVSYYISLCTENKELILEVIKTILRALKTILPRKCKVNATFGTGQADTTGFIYGAYCSLKDSLPGEIYMEPVWIESRAEGNYFLKGKIRIIHFLIAIIKIIANKKVRLLIKKLRRV
jgi:hypothetical protein